MHIILGAIVHDLILDHQVFCMQLFPIIVDHAMYAVRDAGVTLTPGHQESYPERGRR